MLEKSKVQYMEHEIYFSHDFYKRKNKRIRLGRFKLIEDWYFIDMANMVSY